MPASPMLSACTCTEYKHYKFPACATLVFQTNVPSADITLRLYNPATGYLEVSKATDGDGKFTLLTSDVPAYVLNPWIGVFLVAFVYEGMLYEQFYTESGKVVSVEIQAERWLTPPTSYYFYQFRFLLDESGALPEEEGLGYFTLDSTFILA